MRRYFPILIILLFATSLSSSKVKAAPRKDLARTPGELIALINGYRAENGLPAYSQNSILMQIAQGQADYQASIEAVTHEGPGGTRPRDRAYAAGYGGGEIVFVSEIIYGATSAGPGTAVNWWKTSQIHNDTMVASTYVEIGAGVASANDRNYYVAVTGYVAGGSYVPQTSSENGANDEAAVPAVVVIPVVVATPQADGSILHIIRSGQTLWTVAAVYKVPLEELLALNGLPENAVIYPGDEIIIQVASLATPTKIDSTTEAPPTLASTEVSPTQPNATQAQASETSVAVASNQDSATGSLVKEEAENENALTRIIILVALFSITMIVVASFFVRSQPEPPDEKHDPFAPLE